MASCDCDWVSSPSGRMRAPNPGRALRDSGAARRCRPAADGRAAGAVAGVAGAAAGGC